MPGQIRHHEQQIAQFVSHGVAVALRQGIAHFGQFFIQLVQHRRQVRPVETDPRRALLQLLRALECRQGQRHTGQHTALRRPVGAFGSLGRFPGGRALGIRVEHRTREHVRVATQQLVADAGRDVLEIEQAGLLRHLRVEHHLQQQVAKFQAQIVEVLARDGVGHLVSFLQRVRRDAGEILAQIPGTAFLRVTQAGHEFEQTAGVLHGGHYRGERRQASARFKLMKILHFKNSTLINL